MEYDFLKWLGHACFLIETPDVKIFVDPVWIRDSGTKADLIFITHAHFDHFSVEDIKKISTENTRYVAPADVAKRLGRNARSVRPGERGEILGIGFEAVPAYNIGKSFHPKANGWVGYIINVNGKRIYFPGDTDLIEEMRNIDCDLALLPIGGTYTMTVDEAIEATKRIRAKNFAPMHYRAVLGREGSAAAEKKFKENVKNCIILREPAEPRYSFPDKA